MLSESAMIEAHTGGIITQIGLGERRDSEGFLEKVVIEQSL